VTEVRFPALKENEPDAEGLLATWFVEDGDVVKEGQLLCEVQVEKTSADVEASSMGTIHFEVAEGDVVRQGTVIATID
jgi:pyruvate/2-oxoglutarate dehydrogenase complex dihydrolipoamide acyltransferase (E2) component